MKRLLVLGGIILFTFISFPQNAEKFSGKLYEELKSGQDIHTVWVFFTDKGTNNARFLKEPELMLSPRSLARRTKVQKTGSVLDITDLPVSPQYIQAIENTGVKLRHTSRWLNAVSLTADNAQLLSIHRLPFVRRIDAIEKYGRAIPEPVTAAAPAARLLHPDSPNELDYGASLTQLQQINVPALHNLGYNGAGLIIGVLDAGFNRLSHECFSQMQIIAAYDFVNHNTGVGDSTDLGLGWHGTMTLSAIGGYKPGQLIGPAYRAKYVLAKTENTYSETPVEEDNWIAAMEWADSIGVDLTSTSLGYLTYDPPFTSYTWQNMNGNTARITIAADLAVKKGIAVFNSAGNEGYDATHNTLVAPADGDSVIAVGAVNSIGARADFSSVGNTVDGRIKPDIMAMGSGTILASTGSDNQYTLGSGTSFSCPIAAGAAALILQAHPDWTPMQLRDALRMTASHKLNPNREYGWGIINAVSAFQYNPSAAGGADHLRTDYFLDQNYPNPFNPETNIRFSIPNAGPTRLTIYNALGQTVEVPIEAYLQAGTHLVKFHGSDLPSGMYLYELQSGNYRSVRKMILAK